MSKWYVKEKCEIILDECRLIEEAKDLSKDPLLKKAIEIIWNSARKIETDLDSPKTLFD